MNLQDALSYFDNRWPQVGSGPFCLSMNGDKLLRIDKQTVVCTKQQFQVASQINRSPLIDMVSLVLETWPSDSTLEYQLLDGNMWASRMGKDQELFVIDPDGKWRYCCSKLEFVRAKCVKPSVSPIYKQIMYVGLGSTLPSGWYASMDNPPIDLTNIMQCAWHLVDAPIFSGIIVDPLYLQNPLNTHWILNLGAYLELLQQPSVSEEKTIMPSAIGKYKLMDLIAKCNGAASANIKLKSGDNVIVNDSGLYFNGSRVCDMDTYRVLVKHLIGKPCWSTAPSWANYLSQDALGPCWTWSYSKPHKSPDGYWKHPDKIKKVSNGCLSIDWENSLESRPQDWFDFEKMEQVGLPPIHTKIEVPAIDEDENLSYIEKMVVGHHANGNRIICESPRGHIESHVEPGTYFPIGFFKHSRALAEKQRKQQVLNEISTKYGVNPDHIADIVRLANEGKLYD